MFVEGKGRIAPRPVRVRLDRSSCVAVKLQAEEQGAYRNYSGRSDLWGKGIKQSGLSTPVGEISRSDRPNYCGGLGETGVCQMIRERCGIPIYPDFALRKFGDDGVDIDAPVKLQVKTRQGDWPTGLIRIRFRDGIPMHMRAEAHVFCRYLGGMDIDVLGWIWNKDIDTTITSRGAGDWTNIVVPDDHLIAMPRLMSEIKSRIGR